MKAIAILILATVLASSATAQSGDKMTAEQARGENAYALGVQAYLWGYPLRFYGGIVPGALKVEGAYVNDFHNLACPIAKHSRSSSAIAKTDDG
jgi:hypothetical protein